VYQDKWSFHTTHIPKQYIKVISGRQRERNNVYVDSLEAVIH